MPEVGVFSYGNIEGYKSTKRMKDAISDSSWKTLRFGVIAYCNFLKQDPDAIIADRNKTFKAEDLDIRRKHEDQYRQFIDHMKTIKSKRGGGPLAPKSMDNLLIGIRAFYDQNYVKLVKPKKLEGVHPIKVTHVPTQEELGLIADAITHPVYKAVALAEAQSGMSIGDLLSLTWDMKSGTFGTIRKQVDEGVMVNGVKHYVVHIHSVRQKTNVGFDSFFGLRTVEALHAKDYPLSSRVFPVKTGEVDDAISDAAKKVGIEGEVTSHLLRKFFSTQLKVARVGDDLVEYWQGHALQGSRGAYLAPTPIQQVEIYLTFEGNITPLFKGETIIQQVRPAAQLAQGPVVVHELPIASPPQQVDIPRPLPASTPAPVVAPPQQPVQLPVIESKLITGPITPTPVVSTSPSKTVFKVADLLKRLEKKQQ